MSKIKEFLDDDEDTAAGMTEKLNASTAEIQAVIRKYNPSVIGSYRKGERGRASKVYGVDEIREGLEKHRTAEKEKKERLNTLATSDAECSQASFAERFGTEYDIDRGKLSIILKTQNVQPIAKVGKTQIYSIQDVVLGIAAWRKAEDEKYIREYDSNKHWLTDEIGAALEAAGLEAKFTSPLVNLFGIESVGDYRPKDAKRSKNLYPRSPCEEAIKVVKQFKDDWS